MTYWHVEIDLESEKHYTVDMPKTYPDENAADVCNRICQVPYPAFQESEKKYTVLNSKKIIRMEIEEVTE